MLKLDSVFFSNGLESCPFDANALPSDNDGSSADGDGALELEGWLTLGEETMVEQLVAADDAPGDGDEWEASSAAQFVGCKTSSELLELGSLPGCGSFDAEADLLSSSIMISAGVAALFSETGISISSAEVELIDLSEVPFSLFLLLTLYRLPPAIKFRLREWMLLLPSKIPLPLVVEGGNVVFEFPSSVPDEVALLVEVVDWVLEAEPSTGELALLLESVSVFSSSSTSHKSINSGSFLSPCFAANILGSFNNVMLVAPIFGLVVVVIVLVIVLLDVDATEPIGKLVLMATGFAPPLSAVAKEPNPVSGLLPD